MEQPQFDRDTIRRASQLPETERLLAQLQAEDHGALNRAAAQLKAGDIQAAAAQLRPMMESPQVQTLLRQLEKKLG